MTEPTPDDRATKVLYRLASVLKIALILTIYFSLCVLIILVIIGARR